MKELYRNELSQVHAPKELIEKTKFAMNAAMNEECRQKELLQKKNKVNPVRFVPLMATAAAAVLLLILLPNIGRQTKLSDRAGHEYDTYMQNEVLLERFELVPDKITPGASSLKEVETYIIEHYPNEFIDETAIEKEIEEIPVRIVKDEKEGFYKAVFTWNKDKILVMSEFAEMERIIDAVKAVIQTLKEQTKE